MSLEPSFITIISDFSFKLDIAVEYLTVANLLSDNKKIDYSKLIESLKVSIDVKGLEKDKEFNVTLKKPNGITELSVKTITIKVNIDNSISKEFNDISISTENLGSKYKVQAMSEDDIKVTVVVKGSEDIVNKFDASSIKAYIDLKNYGVGEHEVPVKVVGDDVRLTYTSKTKKVKIKITEK